MKKILITGKNSYIGISVKNWLLQTPDKYEVDTIDLRNPEWINEDFSKYDVVLHTAGIAHVSRKRKLKELYFKVNTELTLNVAKKAKIEGVYQFIFMSSIIVYGSKNEVITNLTQPKPDNFYGESKLLAESGLKEIISENFKVVIIRSPMIYGFKSKGNYTKLSTFAKKTIFFPLYSNKRSMLHIDNLCELIKLIIDNNALGLFYPQNKEYINTTNLVNEISMLYDHKISFTKLFNPAIRFFIFIDLIRKLFGDLTYVKDMSNYENYHYQIRDFKESVRLTENGK